MIFLHETHEICGGRIVEFETSLRDVWKPLVERPGEARVLWVWEHTHGTGPSYQVISIVALRDWQVYGELVRRSKERGDLHDWYREICSSRREVTGKILVPTPWSPLQETSLETSPTSDRPAAMYLHDTGWPFPGKLDEYMEALGTVFFPSVRGSGIGGGFEYNQLWSRMRVMVSPPLQHLGKAEIIRTGAALGLDYGLTYSCYDPGPAGRPCGRCDSCRLRAAGFAAAGIADPALLR